MSDEELTTDEVDERLKGLEFTGEPRYIRVSDLTVDPRYQRPLNARRVKEIAAEFDPYVIGMLYVSERSDGTKVLLDGQTRRAALVLMHWEDQMVPCFVYRNLTIEDEARIFRVMNEFRTNPSQVDLFRAKVVEKNPQSIDITRILHRVGLRVGNNPEPGWLRAVSAAERVYRDSGREVFTQVIDTIHEAWPGYEDPFSVSADMVKGLGMLYAEYESEVSQQRLTTALSKETPGSIVGKAKALRASIGGSAPTCMAMTLVGVYNKGRRTNRLQEWQARPWRRNPFIRRTRDTSITGGST